MKNLLKSCFVIVFTFSVFSCNENQNPQPSEQPEIPVMAKSNSAKQGAPGPGDTQPQTGFVWKLVKTVLLKNKESMSLLSPYSVGNFRGPNVKWQPGEANSALEPIKVTFLNLGEAKIDGITPEYLANYPHTNARVYASVADNVFWPVYMFDRTVISVRKTDGTFLLLKAKKIVVLKSIELEVYEYKSVIIH